MNMIPILIATHGGLAKAYFETAELLTGSIKNVYTIGLFHEDSIDEFAHNVEKIITENEHLLIFVDILGGSPCISVAKNIQKGVDCECIVGVNLPLFLEALTSRDSAQSASQLKETILEFKDESILDLKKL